MSLSPDMKNEWELLESPMKYAVAESAETENDESDNNKMQTKERLCGYLWKLGAKGLIKSWKHRWFIYDDRRCLLYYYRKPQDTEPLGNIEIANCTFSFSADEKSLFQISSNDRTYHLQAHDQVTMMFWLQELQTKRRLFNNKDPVLPTNSASSGLLKEQVVSQTKDDVGVGLNKPVSKPKSTVGDHTANTDSSNSWNLSFTNLNKEFKNWRKSAAAIATGEPILPPTKPTFLSLINGPDSIHNDIRKSTDFGFSRLVASLKKPLSPTISLPVSKNPEALCYECQETSSMVAVLKEAIIVAEKEITTRDDVIESLSDQLRIAAKESRKDLSSSEQENHDKNSYINQLTRMLHKVNKDYSAMAIVLKEGEQKLEESLEKEKILKEMILAKDNSIIALTNRIYSLEQSETGKDESFVSDEEMPTKLSMTKEATMDYNQLKEACDAIRLQNNFLNGEILELNALRAKDTEKINVTTRLLTEKDAELLKLKSRYLWLLKEFSAPKRDGSLDTLVASEMVEHLIDDAINENQDPLPDGEVMKEPRYTDKYGFYDSCDKEDDQMLENLADHFDVLSCDKKNGVMDISIGVKWENFMVAQGNVPLTRTEELKGLVRAGVPHEFRARVWDELISLRISTDRSMVGVGYYKSLLREKKGMYSPSAKQIELDLLRTLPNNKFYDKIDAEGTAKLRRVLLAYSWHNPTVGYCQGLNRLGAIALLYLNEESAFWCLVAIVEYLMPQEYFSRTLLGAQIDQRVFRDLLDEKFPKLGAHLQNMQVDLSLISFNWFLTVFVDFFPTELTLRVWDVFLFEGSKVLFRFALAVFKVFEDDIFKFHDAGHLFSFFRKVPKSRFSVQRIWNVAFDVLNPFGRKSIETKRRFYQPQLQAQLDMFEEMRHDYRSKRADSDAKPESTPLSDEDNDL